VTLCGAYELIYIFKCIKIIVIEIINGEIKWRGSEMEILSLNPYKREKYKYNN
jgi:hypothetical protein